MSVPQDQDLPIVTFKLAAEIVSDPSPAWANRYCDMLVARLQAGGRKAVALPDKTEVDYHVDVYEGDTAHRIILVVGAWAGRGAAAWLEPLRAGPSPSPGLSVACTAAMSAAAELVGGTDIATERQTVYFARLSDPDRRRPSDA